MPIIKSAGVLHFVSELKQGDISVVLSDLDSSRLRIWAHGQAPQPRSGAPKAQGLRVRLNPFHHRGDRKYFPTQSLLRLFELWFRSDPRRALCVACGARRTNLYPAGCNPFQGPSCALRGRGLQGGWDHSLPRRLSAMSRSGHTSTLDLMSFCYRFLRYPLRTAPRGTRPVSR